MGTCWNCNKEVTLKKEETKCDSCGNIVTYKCYWCKEWFSAWDEIKAEKLRECKACGYFYCPSCGVCGNECQTKEWKDIISEILNSHISIEEKNTKILDLIEEIKLNKDQKNCIRGVPISYAKGRIKSCYVRMQGYRVKDEEDMKKFEARLNTIMSIDLGKTLSVSKSREKGSYGQEYRDVFYFGICLGKLKKIKIKKYIDGEEKELSCYYRIEEGDCPYLDSKNLIVKICTNPDCKIKTFPLSQTHCVDPRCNYKKGSNKGKPRKLKLKISNKDICQLNRTHFKKEENA